MKSLAMLLATAIAAVATIAASHQASPTPPATPPATETGKSVTTSGEIVRYDAGKTIGADDKVLLKQVTISRDLGKTIVIRQSDDRVVTYALAPAITVSPEVQVGRRVTIFAEPAADGIVRVTRITTIGPEATPAVVPPPTAPYTRETEKTAQTRTVTVTGDVVRYEAGRTIVVRSPDGREVTYSIAPDVSAPAEVTAGRRVSIVTEPSAAGPVLVTRITTDSIAPDGQAIVYAARWDGSPGLEPFNVLTPCLHGVGLVEAHSLRHRIPEALDIRFAEHRLGPPGVRVGNDRPVAQPVAERERALGQLAHPRLADAGAVEVCEELWLRIAGDRAERAARLAERRQPLHEPRRREAELCVGGMLDVSSPYMLVRVENIDIRRSDRVGLACDRPCKWGVFDQGIDAERLARLQVQPDLNGQPCVLLEALVGLRGVGHGGER